MSTVHLILLFFAVHKYIVSVHTGDLWGSETFANIYITVYGERGDTGIRKLQDSLIKGEKFQRNKVKEKIPILFKYEAIIIEI